MPAAYDNYDYPSYWKDRGYEHEAEVVALSEFLKKIPKVGTICDIGAGYGRLTPYYIYRAKKAILADPSSRLLKMARKKFTGKNIKFVHTKIENIPSKIKKNTIDLVFLVRVLHHIKDVDKALHILQKIIKKNGYLIAEFPNKRHLKATLFEFLKGNLLYLLDIFPKDKRSKKSIRRKCIPFSNFHPDQIIEKLKAVGFSIVEIRSVSNFRSTRLKKYIPQNILLFLEKHSQKLFSKIFLGPSVFILANNTR